MLLEHVVLIMFLKQNFGYGSPGGGWSTDELRAPSKPAVCASHSHQPVRRGRPSFSAIGLRQRKGLAWAALSAAAEPSLLSLNPNDHIEWVSLPP